MRAIPLLRWSTAKLAALAFASFAAGCGGGLPGLSASCTAVITNASGTWSSLNGTYDCQHAATAWDSASNTGGFAFQLQQAGTAPAITTGIGWPGEPQTGHYRQNTSGAQGGVMIQSASGAVWSVVAGGGGGTYDLNFTSVSNAVSDSSGKAYTTAGTLHATLPNVSGGATGTLTIDVTF
jgi:hypothetical protein